MQLEVGKIYEGKVTGITSFGAFIELGPNTTGMVHISEIASTYVNEIKDYIKEGDIVKTKVLSIGDDGKISLSIKKAIDGSDQMVRSQTSHTDRINRTNNKKKYNSDQGNSKNNNRIYEKKSATKTNSSKSDSFEDMLSKFKQRSEEKMSDLKKNMDNKRRGYSRRGGQKF